MKKIFLTILFLIPFLFVSCYTDTGVLYNIRGDVKSEKSTIIGTIRTITRYNVGNEEFLVLIGETNKSDNSKLFVKNKNEASIFYKPASSSSHGEWLTYNNLPFSSQHSYNYQDSKHVGEQMILTHASDDTLYIITAEYINDNDEGTSYPNKYHIYAKQITLADGNTWNEDGEWTDILANSNINFFPMYIKDSYYQSAFSVFSTNTIDKNHRKVYIRTGDAKAANSNYTTVKYYELNGLNTPSEISVSPVDSSSLNNANSATYFNGNYIFFNSIAVTTNETPSTAATKVYYGENKYIYTYTGNSNPVKGAFNVGEQISCLAVCKDSLLIGRANFDSTSLSSNGGIKKTTLDSNGNIGLDFVSFDTNAEIQLSSAYFIFTLLNVNPSKTEKESILYSSISYIGTGSSTAVSSSNVGLWSYYPSRGNWNCE